MCPLKINPLINMATCHFCFWRGEEEEGGAERLCPMLKPHPFYGDDRSLTEASKPDLVGSQVLEVPLLIPFVWP